MNALQKQSIANMRGKGESYAKIAAALHISENTVKSYCRRNNLGTIITVVTDKGGVSGVCKNCNQPLVQTPKAKKKQFCSDTCRMAWWNAHPEEVNRKAVYNFVCEVCGSKFTAYGDAHRKYCSRACSYASRTGRCAGDE